MDGRINGSADLCEVDGCNVAYFAKGKCKFHYDRAKSGVPMDRPKQSRFVPPYEAGVGYKWCSKCQQLKATTEFNRDSARSDGYFPQCKSCRHPYVSAYNQRPDVKSRESRWRAEQLKARVCTIEGCGKPTHETYCSMHRARLKRNGDPLTLTGPNPRRGAENYAWKGDGVGYFALHDRIRRRRGRAAEYRCVRCGSEAAQWAYDHEDDAEKVQVLDGAEVPYSTDVYHYQPMCIPCHKSFDLDYISERDNALTA